jgi:hypothetical protein
VRRRIAVLVVAVTATACSGTVTGSGAGHRDSSGGPPVTAVQAERYNSIGGLVAATQVAVVATAVSVAPDPSAPQGRPDSLVTLHVQDVIRGKVGRQIVVSETDARPGVVDADLIPIKVGHAYLLCLGRDARTGRFFVIGGDTGLFGFDPATQEVTRLDPLATAIPPDFSLANARLTLGQFPAPWGTTCDPVLQLAADALSVMGGTIESIEPYTGDPQVKSVLVDVPVAIGGSGPFPPQVVSLSNVGSAPGEAPLAVGHSYVMFLADGPPADGTPTMQVVNGLEGLFAFDPQALTATRLDALDTRIPATLTWAQVTSLMAPSPPQAKNPCTSPPDATTTTSPPPVLNPAPPETTIINPDTYRPSYDTIASLYADSGLAFIATVEPLQSDPTQGTYEAFPLTKIWVVGYTGTLARVDDFDLPQGQPGDVPLVVGRTYLIFYGTDSTAGYSNCIIGGLRGIFDYDSATGIVTRIDHNAGSRIPPSQPIGQIAAQLEAFDDGPRPPLDSPSPPLCSPSVTGS